MAGASAVFADGGVTFTNIAAGDQAGVTYRRVVSPDRLAVRLATAAAPIPIPEFFEKAVVNSPQKWHGAPGVAVFDYDRDGDLDVYVTNGPGANNSLYSNQLEESGTVSFIDVGEAAGVGLKDHDSNGVCYGDVDNDGDEDLYVLGAGFPNHLFENNGNGTFTDITATAGVSGASNYYYSSCSMGDVNGDGLLDIVVGTTYHPWTHRHPVFIPAVDPGTEPDYLFVNTGHDVFTDASVSSGIRNLINAPEGKTVTWAIALVDIDQDGDLDIMNAEDAGPPPQTDRGLLRLLKNDGTGHFTDETYNVGLNVNGGFMGFAYADFNCDGNLDFFVTDLGAYLAPAQPSRWYLQNSNGTFTYPGVGAFRSTPFGWGVSSLDYDNDGDADVIYHGSVDMVRTIIADNPGVLLRNDGNCSAAMSYDAGAVLQDHRLRTVEGVAVGDLNNDGFDDIISVSEFDIHPFNYIPIVPFVVPTPRSPVFDPIARAEIGYFPLTPGFFTFLEPDLVDGTLSLEINSAGNGNRSVQLTALGTKDLVANPHSAGRVNRDGIGAVIRFTPDGGKTSIRPVLGGASYASQDSLRATFGLGTAAKGTADVLWPGGVRNRLYDVAAGESVALPEIPCSFDTFQSGLPANANATAHRNQYEKCVRESLKDLTKKNVISGSFASRLAASALRAYDASH
jgi:hypothetical protein